MEQSSADSMIALGFRIAVSLTFCAIELDFNAVECVLNVLWMGPR